MKLNLYLHSDQLMESLQNKEDKWKPQYAYALEDSSLITFKYKDVRDKIKDLNLQIKRAEDSEFLLK